jgi:DNA helicase-2/ATP-dependent DNA helicase PcrA
MVLCGQRDIGGSLPEQVIAAAHRGRNARLLAGPGTGKTRTIVELITSLISNGDALPNEILCLTFTRAAAAGLRSKVRRALGPGVEPEIYTLHGFALRQLMTRHANVGAGTARPRIADDWEERHIVLEDLKKLLAAARIEDVRDRLKDLAAAWETRPEDDPMTTHPDAEFVGALAQHKRQYGYILRSELVFLLKQTLDQDPDFLSTATYKWVIVDEYQDLNRCDIAVIDRIAAGRAHLFVAGDDDQSIYEHLRHAHPNGIREFDTTHAASDLRLATCVRCDRRIIDVATSVIRQEVGRTPKALDPHVTAGPGIVESLFFDNGAEEARGIAALTEKLLRAGVAPHEVMVLLRSDHNGAFSTPIDDAMRALGVAAIVRTEEKSTLNMRDGRVLLAYLRLVFDWRDHLAWRTALTEGRMGVGAKAIEELHALSAARNELPLADVLDLVRADPAVVPSRGNAIAAAVEAVRTLVDELRAEIAGAADVEDQISLAVAKFPPSTAMTLVEGELQALRLAFAATDLADLLAQIALRREEEEAVIQNTVNIMSMHKAKGLDACVVIIAAAEEELLPGPNNRGEERRLLYVSLTRARHALFVFHAKRRYGQQARSGIGDPGNHQRTLYLNTAGLPARRGSAFITAFTPDPATLAPLPNPAAGTPTTP